MLHKLVVETDGGGTEILSAPPKTAPRVTLGPKAPPPLPTRSKKKKITLAAGEGE